MEYRKLPRGEERISTLGLGNDYMVGLSTKEVVKIFDYAIENGVNIIDYAQPVSRFDGESKSSTAATNAIH